MENLVIYWKPTASEEEITGNDSLLCFILQLKTLKINLFLYWEYLQYDLKR